LNLQSWGIPYEAASAVSDKNTIRLKNNAKRAKFSFSFAVTHSSFNPLLIA